MQPSSSQSGSIFYFILIGIVLIGGLTFALRDSGGLESNIDKESAMVQASQILKYSGELQRGVQTLLSNGISENDIRFAYPGAAAGYGTITTTPQNQVFSSQGGQIPYRKPPTGSNDGSAWEFNSGGNAFQVGSAKADLVAAAAYITDPVCKAINRQVGLPEVVTSLNCVSSSTPFDGTYATSPLNPTWTPAPTTPAMQACVTCDYGGGLIVNLYYTVLLAR